MLLDVTFMRDHYAHIILPLTIYGHKMKNPNPKKKSTGKTTFFTKVLRPEKRKIKYPPFLGVFCNGKVKVQFLGDQI